MQESESIQPLLDQLFLLYTINQFERGIKITKLQKIMFLSQWNGNDKGYQSSGFNFIRFLFGPFSKEINPSIRMLADAGLVQAFNIPLPDKDSQSSVTRPLEKAEKLLKLIKPLKKKNLSILTIFDRVIKHLGSMTLDVIKARIYKAEFRGTPIANIPMHTPLIGALASARIKHSFRITQDWVMTLEVLFDLETQNSINEGLVALGRGDVIKRDDFFKTL